MSSKPDDRLLTAREIAAYMQMGERTVLKLAEGGGLPGLRIAGQWRFKREVIDAWLVERMGVSSDDEAELDPAKIPDGTRLPLGELLDVESVLPDLSAKDRAQAIEALVQRAFERGFISDKPWFIGAIVERESLAPTAMEGGVAFLHTRQRGAAKVVRPFIVVGRSWQGVDFGALDARPTHLFFLLGLKYDRLHLPILGRLARLAKGGGLVNKLRAAPTAQRIRELLLQEDLRLARPKGS
ncbi:MAG TPA: PTS sugar transporter subunit IIA [Polyangia bacterium]|nr:PTS sugar transporter subunit IIA [Polyangia bacterium]